MLDVYMNNIHIQEAIAGMIGPDQIFQDHLKRGAFMIQRGRNSGHYFFYPRAIEPGTGATDLEWVPACGSGTVYAVTVIRPKPPQEPYNVALIELDEGPRMMSRVEGVAPEAVKIGLRVTARIAIDAKDETAFVVFDPAVDRK